MTPVWHSAAFPLVSPVAGIRDRLDTAWHQLVEIAFHFVVVLILFLIARAIAKFIQRRVWKRVPIDEVTPATESLINNTVAVILYALAFTSTLAFLGASWSSLLTAFSISTLAVAFGLQDLLKSILGGAFLIVERPYEVGNRIRIRDNEGEVTEIGVRTTTIVTDDDATVVVPNSLYLGEPFRNLDRSILVSTVVHVVGIDGKRADVLSTITETLSADPPVDASVVLSSRREWGVTERTLSALNQRGFGGGNDTVGP
ncbi:MAG: mechanosensitive ion channel family protein [Thermomicrobiales bacterium]|nr:mechanosensitive ion channel family protein [Thermomicrobiales bacterium]